MYSIYKAMLVAFSLIASNFCFCCNFFEVTTILQVTNKEKINDLRDMSTQQHNHIIWETKTKEVWLQRGSHSQGSKILARESFRPTAGSQITEYFLNRILWPGEWFWTVWYLRQQPSSLHNRFHVTFWQEVQLHMVSHTCDIPILS